MSRRALLVIDMQNDYFAGGKWTLDGIDAAADKTARLMAAAREHGDLVVHVRHEFLSPDAPFFVPGSDGAKINGKVAPQAGEPVVLKNQVNAFHDTELKAVLDSHGVDELVIAGAMSHMCVDGTARAASDLGYAVTIVHDACATRDVEFEGQVVPAAQVHAAYMSALGFAYGDTVSAEAFLGTTR